MADINSKMLRQAPMPRRATNVTLPERLLSEARDLKINVSQACERGLSLEIQRQKEQRWLAENNDAMNEYNDWIEKNGVPLADFRQF